MVISGWMQMPLLKFLMEARRSRKMQCGGGGGKSYTNEYSIAQEWVFLINYP